tara:strand:- start:863 stop:1396 length:534 start_codon:yes stop_codon:yes gene_type:complete
MAEKAYRGVLKARISKLYGGDVTIGKAKKLKARPSATNRDKQLANWFINMQQNRPSPGKMSDTPFKMSPLKCWKGYERVPGTEPGAKGSCRKSSPIKKQKGGGTTKTCLPAAKIKSLSSKKRAELVSSKKSAGASGKYKRSSKTNVKGARPKGATLRDWFEKEDWRRVDDPSKKCGE